MRQTQVRARSLGSGDPSYGKGAKSRLGRPSSDREGAQRNRPGFTYVEMMMVITIIGVLVALLLPAVQAAREAARRGNCQRTLLQLILAVQNYELHHEVYPPGTIDAKGPILNQPIGYHHNWVIQILPFLEEKNSWRHIDNLVGVYHANNLPVRQLDVSVVRCPSVPRSAKGYSDYAAVHNDVEAPIDVDNNGVFFLNSHIGYNQIPDGTSNTIFIGEKWTFIGDLGWMSGTRATLRNMGARINGTGRGIARIPGGGKIYQSIPQYPPVGSASDGSGADTPIPDEDLLRYLSAFTTNSDYVPLPPRVVRQPPTDVKLVVGGFSSLHPGGAQFAFGDGSIQFLSETIDITVYSNLANRADGHSIPQF